MSTGSDKAAVLVAAAGGTRSMIPLKFGQAGRKCGIAARHAVR